MGSYRSLTVPVLSGMALFVKTYETELNDSTFVKQLPQADPDEINRRGRADFSANNVALRFARVILEKYNGQRGRQEAAVPVQGVGSYGEKQVSHCEAR